jgi:hypothetical protein
MDVQHCDEAIALYPWPVITGIQLQYKLCFMFADDV